MIDPTPEQVEAARAEYDRSEDMCAALVAAAGAAPQEPGECSGDSECCALPHEHGCFADAGNCEVPAEHAAPVQVDEAKLSRLIERHSCATLASEGRRVDQETICAECGWAFSIRADRTSPNQESRRKFDHVAHVVAEWLRGGGQ